MERATRLRLASLTYIHLDKLLYELIDQGHVCGSRRAPGGGRRAAGGGGGVESAGVGGGGREGGDGGGGGGEGEAVSLFENIIIHKNTAKLKREATDNFILLLKEESWRTLISPCL